MEATATSVVTQPDKTEKPKKKGKQRKKNIEHDEVEVPETQFDDSDPSNIPTLEGILNLSYKVFILSDFWLFYFYSTTNLLV